jgi:fused signal recognition particle receptor
MFNLLKRKKANVTASQPVTEPPVAEKKGFFTRLKQGLTRTRTRFSSGIGALILGKKTLDGDLIELIETQLLTADVGVEASDQLIQSLTAKLKRNELADSRAVLTSLQEEMKNILRPCQQALEISDDKKPFVILVAGINGAGKTTTIGKLAKNLQAAGESVMLAAGDTFRAAAVEQLQVWGERNNIAVVAQQSGSDTAAVIFDALSSARAKNIDVLIADTAGRLHTQSNLMEELKKVKRVIAKLDPQAPHETLLVLDASIGQNAVNQAKQFHDAIGITGLALTKLDGTAKGGIIFAIAKQMQIPIRFIGVGEGIDDLRPFNADDFVNALFEITDESNDRSATGQ